MHQKIRLFSNILRHKLGLYWSLIKSPQTSLLLTTGLAGFMSARCPVVHWQTLLALTGSLFLSISGSTILNMWYDRDIDSRMARTCMRPLPSGKIEPSEAFILGLLLSFTGIAWAFLLDPIYGMIVFLGVFFDVIVYTIWLKRRTCWSIICGGVSGGMPILAGRVLGVGGLDWIGLALTLAVLFWIPTHIMTFSMRYYQDYCQAGIPTFPATYGFSATRAVIAISSLLAALAMGISAYGVGMAWGFWRLFGIASFGLLVLAVFSLVRPSERLNFGLFKYASAYMLAAMLLLFMSGL